MLVPALLVAAAAALWATRLVPEPLTAMLFFACAMMAQAAPGAVIFAGFASAAFWLVLSGYVLGIAIRKTGLAERGARAIAARMASSYPRLVAGVVVLTYALAFVMPSNMGRIAVLMPIILAVADTAGLAPGRKGRAGLVMAVGFGTFMLSTSVLPANVPNLVMAGSIETVAGIHLRYLPYLLTFGPVMGLLKGAALVAAIVRLCPDRLTAAERGATQAAPPWGRDERRLAVLLGATLALWLTDGWHGISPAWIGLAAACVCLLPRIGFVDQIEFARDVGWGAGIYVAGILGMAGLAAQSGLGAWLGRALVSVAPLDPAAPFQSFAALVGIATTLNFVVTSNGVPALYTPLGDTLAHASGLPLATALTAQVLGFSNTVLPYQAAPVVVALQMGGVRSRAAVPLCLVLAAVTFLLLVPAQYLVFRMMGGA